MRGKLVVFSVLIVAVGVVSFGFEYEKNIVKVDRLEVNIDSSKVNNEAQKNRYVLCRKGVVFKICKKICIAKVENA